MGGAVGAGVGAVEVRDEVYGRDGEAGVAVDGVGVEDAAGLVGAVWVGGPEVGEGGVGACEGEVYELGYPGMLGGVGGGVFFADCEGGAV